MKSKYFNKLVGSLFIIGIFLIFLAVLPLEELPENMRDFVKNLIVNFGVSIIMLAITISFIQYYLDNQQLITIEKYKKMKEKENILKHHTIVLILIGRYSMFFSNLTNSNDENKIKFNLNDYFTFRDLSGLYEINGFVTTNLLSSKIKVFYDIEELLTKQLEKMLGENDFEYNSELKNVLIELKKVSLDHNELREGILSNEKIKEDVKRIIESDEQNWVSKYLNGELRGNLAIPFVKLYLCLIKQRRLINQYLKIIEEIKDLN